MDKEQLKKLGSDARFIPGIHNYCDRWCERCAFTSRCMNYALSEEEFEESETRDINNEAFWQKLHEIFQTTLEMAKETAEEMGIDLNSVDAEAKDRIELRDVAEKHPVCRSAKRYAENVKNWFEASGSAFEAAGMDMESRAQMEIAGDNPEEDLGKLQDAVSAIQWYQHFIYVKLLRAVRGLLEFEKRLCEYVAGDAEGSAKVALVAIDRSIAAWGELLVLMPEQEDGILNLLVQLEKLRRATEQTVPGARAFVRPGLDE